MIRYHMKETRNKHSGKSFYYIDNKRVKKSTFVLVSMLADNHDCFSNWYECSKGLQYYCKFAIFNSADTLKGIL